MDRSKQLYEQDAAGWQPTSVSSSGISSAAP